MDTIKKDEKVTEAITTIITPETIMTAVEKALTTSGIIKHFTDYRGGRIAYLRLWAEIDTVRATVSKDCSLEENKETWEKYFQPAIEKVINKKGVGYSMLIKLRKVNADTELTSAYVDGSLDMSSMRLKEVASLTNDTAKLTEVIGRVNKLITKIGGLELFTFGGLLHFRPIGAPAEATPAEATQATK